MNGGESYNVNFFKPTTPFLKENIKAIIIGLVIWAVATYGFQILLKIVETPTPEQGYLVYEKVYPKLKQGSATPEEKKEIAVVYLSLIGKAIPLQKNTNLKGVFTATINDILPDVQKADFAAAAANVQNDKKIDLGFIENALGIQNNIALKAVLPFAIAPMDMGAETLVNAEIPPIMDKYLIHNQSFLTDSIFLGFPFHYFYTALFLLTLFVVICLVYCRVMDTMMKKYDMESAYE